MTNPTYNPGTVPPSRIPRQPDEAHGYAVPKPEWVVKDLPCPNCVAQVIVSIYYCGENYMHIFECWNSIGQKATCGYRRIP